MVSGGLHVSDNVKEQDQDPDPNRTTIKILSLV